MEVCHIFSPAESPDEGLWACKYDGDPNDAFRSLFNQWEDPEWMQDFCKTHLSDVHQSFGPGTTPSIAANDLMDEADELKQLMYDCATCQPAGRNLQELFKPLNNKEGYLMTLQPSKGHLQKEHLRRSGIDKARLRIYAVRIGENTFVVTGGAIKLTHLMKEREHTDEQLQRIKTARDWLKQEGISYPDDLPQL